MRARDLGVRIGRGQPGPHNAITDVAGVRVGHTTLIEGHGRLVVGRGPVRTGVTVILPHEGQLGTEPLFAGCHRLNGNGEMTGLEWLREAGLLMTPIAITNTHSLGVVRDALVTWEIQQHAPSDSFWSLPVVGETWDRLLNDVNGQHVKAEHVSQAIERAAGGPVPEGNVGGGTGMICHGFKGGVGTASRVLPGAAGGYTVGVLAQANHGRRERLRVDGVPVGEMIPASEVPLPGRPAEAPQATQGAGSIIIVVATDAPLLPHQCARLAQRAGLGVARMGGTGEHSSGDLFIAFSTGNRGAIHHEFGEPGPVMAQIAVYSNSYINQLFWAVVEATEEAIVNALLAAETMTGRDDIVAYRLEPDRLTAALAQRGWTPAARVE
jgi:D-aminopeptidase